MTETSEARMLIEALRILTRADQGGLSFPAGSDKCRFDQLLCNNAEGLQEKLNTDPQYAMLLSRWRNDTTLAIPSQCASRWDFVLYCLKTLHLLQETLKLSVTEYNKEKRESVRPSGAPQVSPDTLNFEEQKVVLTTVQFVVCLGVSPNLDKGVGIPAAVRSEFSKLIRLSSDVGEIENEERQQRLFTCLNVLISCIFTHSLGSVILSRHLTDILAGLLQLTHSVRCPQTVKTEDKSKLATADGMKTERIQTNAEMESKELSYETNEISLPTDAEGDGPNKSQIPGVELPPASQISPASIVDHVRKSFQDKTVSSIESQQPNVKESVEDENRLPHDEDIAVSDSGTESNNEISTRGKTDVNKTGTLTEDSEINIEYCEKVLDYLIEKIYPPLLVKTLLLLQGGPKRKKPESGKFALPPAPVWLRKACGKHLTAVIMRPKGVQSVLRGMLDSPGQGQGMQQASDWRKCDAVAKVIACCPLQSFSVESYYKTIAPQILEILHIPDKQVARQFLRVACSTITCMAGQYPELTRQYVILPLIEPLMRCTENNELVYETNQPIVVVEEGQLSTCIEDCHRVFVSGTTANPRLIESLQPVMLTLFQLLLFTKPGISALKTACHELIITYLKQVEQTVALTCLEMMAFQKTMRPGHSFIRMHPEVVFAHGSSGGVVAVYNHDGDGGENLQEICVQCMVDLLKDLQKAGTAGEFLIYMLQELTAILKTEVEAHTVPTAGKSHSSDGEVLKKIETEYQSEEEQFYRKLMLLNLLAAVCDSLGPSCIKNTRNTLEFVKATLERAVEVCRATTDSVFGMFESETLTMAMGLLTAVLTGAMELTSEDRRTMEDLLPLLQDISDHHPESSVQEMASDLRIAIATHGAVWSEVTRSTAEDFTKMKSKLQQSVDKQQKPVKKQPLIEVVSEHSDKISVKYKQETDDSKNNSGAEIKDTIVAGEDTICNENSRILIDNIGPEKKTVDDTYKDPNINRLNLQANETVSEINMGINKQISECESESGKTGRKAKPESGGTSADNEDAISELTEAFKELCDPLLPVRGHGLIRLTRMVQRRDKEVYAKKNTFLKIFEENLDHTDSYMYLASVNGLAAMSDMFPEFVIPRLCEQFANIEKDGKKRSPELRMKLGEIMVKASRHLGDTIPKYRDLLLSTVLIGARDTDSMVRASSMSNLGEICKLLHFSLGNIVQEVFLCCKSLLKSDSDAEVRKGAAVALTLLLQGLGKDILQVLDSLLLDLYRLLKLVMSQEKDDQVKVNANLALNELEDIMKGVIFPQQKLEKRIRVLDME